MDAGLAAEAAEDADFYRWYGAWASYTPARVAERFDGIGVPWWIVGGWAGEAFSGVRREHEDVDVGFFREDLPRVLAHLSPDLCVWSNLGGTIRPLRKAEELLEGARQLWVRPNGDSPWVMDLAMTPHEGTTWIAPRDHSIRRPLEEATFTAADGIRYLQPELVMFMKAFMARSKADRDLEVILRTLAPERRAWLLEAIEGALPGHRWLATIAAARAQSEGRP